MAEYKLEYPTDDGSNWSDLGTPVKRSMVNTYDDGIVSLTGLLEIKSEIKGKYNNSTQYFEERVNKSVFRFDSISFIRVNNN